MSNKSLHVAALAALVALGAAGTAAAAPVTLSIESWRSEGLAIWRDQVIPAFEKTHPNIHVQFTPTAPAE